MKKYFFLALLLSASILVGSDLSHASIVGSSTTGLWSSIPYGDPYVTPFVSFTAAPGFHSPSGPVYEPFGDVIFSSSVVGTSLLVDSGADFDSAVVLLTNGSVDTLAISFYLYGIHNTIDNGYEWATLTGPGFTYPDFQGSVIEWMKLTFDSYSSLATVNSAGEPGFETTFQYTITYGNGPAPVPEPGAILFLVSGLIGLAGLVLKEYKIFI